jgi:hypothetical protein
MCVELLIVIQKLFFESYDCDSKTWIHDDVK